MKPEFNPLFKAVGLALALTSATSLVSAADPATSPDLDLPASTYAVTITNLTAGQYFTPVIAATHTAAVRMFRLGHAPSQELADLAEGGDTSGMQALLESFPNMVMDVATTGEGLIGPGESRTIMIEGSLATRLSLAGMLLPTNDSFVGLDAMPLPQGQRAATLLAYDAGSETNDELCASIPGPQCGGEPFSDGLAEGYVHVSRGIAGEADLSAAEYDWRNPVAEVRIVRTWSVAQ